MEWHFLAEGLGRLERQRVAAKSLAPGVVPRERELVGNRRSEGMADKAPVALAVRAEAPPEWLAAAP